VTKSNTLEYNMYYLIYKNRDFYFIDWIVCSQHYEKSKLHSQDSNPDHCDFKSPAFSCLEHQDIVFHCMDYDRKTSKSATHAQSHSKIRLVFPCESSWMYLYKTNLHISWTKWCILGVYWEQQPCLCLRQLLFLSAHFWYTVHLTLTSERCCLVISYCRDDLTWFVELSKSVTECCLYLTQS
jgi:hypothetical protein